MAWRDSRRLARSPARVLHGALRPRRRRTRRHRQRRLEPPARHHRPGPHARRRGPRHRGPPRAGRRHHAKFIRLARRDRDRPAGNPARHDGQLPQGQRCAAHARYAPSRRRLPLLRRPLETDPPGAVGGPSGAARARSSSRKPAAPVRPAGRRPHPRIGGVDLPILGTVKKLPGEANTFASIAPRVLIPRDKLSPALTVRGQHRALHDSYLKLAAHRWKPPALVARHTATSSTSRKLETRHRRAPPAPDGPRLLGREPFSFPWSASSRCCWAASGWPAPSTRTSSRSCGPWPCFAAWAHRPRRRCGSTSSRR